MDMGVFPLGDIGREQYPTVFSAKKEGLEELIIQNNFVLYQNLEG